VTREEDPIDPIVSQLRQALQELSGKAVPLVAATDEQVLDRLAGRFDAAHAVVLRGLIEMGETPRMNPRIELSATVRTRFEALRMDVHDRLRAIENDLPQRFSAGTLGSRLREAGWYRPSANGGWETSGRGTRKDLRGIFLLACRDLTSELERILVQCQSRCDHLDDLVAKQWLVLDGEGNGARLVACFAEGLRPEESERRKAWRARVPLEAESSFCEALAGRWEKRTASDLEQLHRIVSEPWGSGQQDGFVGFSRRFVGFARSVSDAMVWFSTSRWTTLLDGLPSAPTRTGSASPDSAPPGSIPSSLPTESDSDDLAAIEPAAQDSQDPHQGTLA
jgi:hypothetical protein